MKQNGYALIDIKTGEEIITIWGLPTRIDLASPKLRADIDKVGLVLPDSKAPLYKVVERWEDGEDEPDDYKEKTEGQGSFDGEKLIVPISYTLYSKEEEDAQEAANRESQVKQISTSILKTLLDHENRIRALEGVEEISEDELKDVIREKLTLTQSLAK